MAKSLDILALFEGHIAAGADLIAGVAGLGAGRVLGVNELGIVAESGNGLLTGENFLTDLADGTLAYAGLGAGGSLCLNVNGGVIDHLGLFAGLHDLAAELADDIAGVAFLCAGCFLDVCELVGCGVCYLRKNGLVYAAISISLVGIALGAFFNLDTGTLAGRRYDRSFYPVVLSRDLDYIIRITFIIGTAFIGTILIIFVYFAIYAILAVGINSSSGNHVVGRSFGDRNADFLDCPFACTLIKCKNSVSQAIAMASYKLAGNDDVGNAVFVSFQAFSITEIKVFIKVESYATVSLIASCTFPYISFAVVRIAVLVNIRSISNLCRSSTERFVLLSSFFLTGKDFMAGSAVFISGTADYRTEGIFGSEGNRSAGDTGFILLHIRCFACSYNFSLCCAVYAAYGISVFVISRGGEGNCISIIINKAGNFTGNSYEFCIRMGGISLNKQVMNFAITLLICSCVCIVAGLQLINSIFRICNEQRIPAILAEYIAPAVYLASGSYFNMEVIIKMLKCCFGFVISLFAILACKRLDIERLAAIGAVADGQTGSTACGSLNFNRYGVLALFAGDTEQSKRRNGNTVGRHGTIFLAFKNSTAVVTDYRLNTGNLFSAIFLDADFGYISHMLTHRCRLIRRKDSGSRQQGRDHENRHQHADKSLFHVSS